MKTTRVTNRIHVGETIFNAAELADTAVIEDRLKAFRESHDAYADAQAVVDVACDKVQEVLDRIAALDAVQDEAVETLSRHLLFEGKSRSNPFASYGCEAPVQLIKVAAVKEAAAIRKLVKAIRIDSSLSEASHQVAEAADRAAAAVTEAFADLPALEAALRKTRQHRDHIGDQRDEALRHLRYGARYAEGEGVTGLYDTLFCRTTRKPAKRLQASAEDVADGDVVGDEQGTAQVSDDDPAVAA